MSHGQVDKKRAFLLRVAAEYIEAPEGFHQRWEDSTQRREMIRQFTSTYGYDRDQLAALIDENLSDLQAQAAEVGLEVAEALSGATRYPGNKVYVESVSPAKGKKDTMLHVSVVVWTEKPVVEVYLVSDTNKRLPLATTSTAARKVFATNSPLDAGMWKAVAVVDVGGAQFQDEFVSAIYIT